MTTAHADDEKDPWSFLKGKDKVSEKEKGELETRGVRTSGYGYEVPTFSLAKSCTHAMSSFDVGANKKVYLSAIRDVDKAKLIPDVGVYLDQSWMRNRVAGLGKTPIMYLGWPDMSTLPMEWLTPAVKRANWYVKQDLKVEIGCIGGHGRTGTFLACLLVYRMGITGSRAIQLVRTGHCKRAIETPSQEDLIIRFSQLQGIKQE